MRPLVFLVAAGLLAGAVGAVLIATDGSGSSGKQAPRPTVDRFDSHAAWRLLENQLKLGPRPAGSAASRELARRLRRKLPHGRYQPVPGGLRNIVGRLPGRGRGYLVLGAHYDTKDIPGFVGANDGASGTAIVTQLARTLTPHRLRRTIVFVLFDGEESPRGTPDADFEREGLRGSKLAARRYDGARAMLLLDFVGDKRLRIPREQLSDAGLWKKLRAAAKRVGVGRYFPKRSSGGVYDDHYPFLLRGLPSIDLIDFDFPCFHRTCDDLSAVSERSLDAVGETVRELLASL
jgi:peptidase M28-like protein